PARPFQGGRDAPIWSCSRRGLPCRPGCPVRGGLLPHPFTLALLRSPSSGGRALRSPQDEEGRFAFCGAIPGVAPGGRYPPPCRRGARTFLELAPAIARPSGPRGKWAPRAERSTLAHPPGDLVLAQRGDDPGAGGLGLVLR